MPEVFDVIVLGAGGVGSSTLMHLARRGARVLAIEQFEAVHARGSSHGRTRAIRQAYFEHPAYVPLLQRAYELWHELEQAVCRKLFYRTGLLQIGRPDGELVRGVLRASREYDLPIRMMDAARLVRELPQFCPDGDTVGLWEENAGFLLVEECIRAHLEVARQFGGVVRTREPVRELHRNASEIRVVTSSNAFVSQHLVVCCGPWSCQWLPDLRPYLQVVRKHVYWVDQFDPRFLLESQCPVFFFETRDGFFYGFPAIDSSGVKLAEHSGGEMLSPNAITSTLDTDERATAHVEFEHHPDWQRVADFANRYLVGVDSKVAHYETCWYTLTPDRNFVIDVHGDGARTALAAGLSGHGFKFCTVLGEILADLVLTGHTQHPIDFLAPSRLRKDEIDELEGSGRDRPR
jgi:monomeric sarcosine oxidase